MLKNGEARSWLIALMLRRVRLRKDAGKLMIDARVDCRVLVCMLSVC